MTTNSIQNIVSKENKELFNKILDEANYYIKKFETSEVNCALIGMSGAGKSSLINSIVGKKIAKVGSTEQTIDVQKYSTSNGLNFFDLPGCGTDKFPKDTYIDKFNLVNYDILIIVTSNRLYENDTFLYKNLVSKGKKVFIVRTKMDLAIEDEMIDNDLTEEQVIDKVSKNLKESLKNYDFKPYLVSSRGSNKYDLPTLLDDIKLSLNGIKKDKFLSEMATLSKKHLEDKKVLAEKVINNYSLLASVNSLNPIPGLDVGVDLSILFAMSTYVQKIFGLNEESVKYIASVTGGTALSTNRVLAPVTNFISTFVSKGAIEIFIKKYAKTTVVKSLAKFIPFIGTVVSGVMSYKLCFSYGESLLNAAVDVSANLFDEIHIESSKKL